MIEELDTAVLELDSDNRVILANNAAEHCLGRSRERLAGQPLEQVATLPADLRDALSATRRDQHRRHLRACRLEGGLFDCNIRLLEDSHLLMELYNLEWEQQRHQLEQRHVQTGMLDLLRRNLGHEIRNPLGGIRGAAQMMANELEGSELVPLAQLIMREVDRIDELIQRFGQPELQRRLLDIHLVIDEALQLMLAESGGAMQTERDFDPSIPRIYADASALRQVFLNLALNAHQANASRIRVCTRIEHGPSLLEPGHSTLLRVDIEDDGDGVPAAIRPMLFLPMVTGRRDGTGLGLALAQQIAAAHGGLLAYTEREQGSRFSLRLPLTQQGERGPAHD